MNDLILIIGDGDIVHKITDIKLSSMIEIVEDKGFVIQNQHQHNGDICLSGSGDKSFFAVSSHFSDEIVAELRSTYIYLPAEKAKNKKYYIVKAINGKTAVVDDNYYLFSINDSSPDVVVPVSGVIREVDFEMALSYHRKLLVETIIEERSAACTLKN